MARIALSAPDDWSRRRAMRALELHAGELTFFSYLFHGIRSVVKGDGDHDACPLTPAAFELLLAPAPETLHNPKVRLIRYLTEGYTSDPRPDHARPEDVAEWLVSTTLATTDEGVVSTFGAVLRHTDEPLLLDALDNAFSIGLGYKRFGPPPSLWTEDKKPARLTEIVLSNPHFPRPPLGDGGHYVAAPEVLMAVLKDRLDLVDECVRRLGPWATVAYLLRGVTLPAPADFVERCHTALRELTSPAARNVVCEAAMSTRTAARAVAIDAEYMPTDEIVHPIFLFVTEQWDRYDRLDPDGELLRAYCASHLSYYGGIRRSEITALAVQHGREDPFPPPPPPTTRSDVDRGRNFSGSWPTDFGNHGGGDYGGSGHVGGFGHF